MTDTIDGRSLGSEYEVEMGRSSRQRKEVEKYLAFRRAGFSHTLALRFSRGR